MIVLMFVLIMTGRDMGPMLVAERKARVYEITDGGDGKGRSGDFEGKDSNQPEDDTPPKSWNMTGPVLLLVFFIFWLLVQTGTIEGEQQTFMEKIEASDSYSALLWGTMATVWCTIIFYLLQIVHDGRLVWPNMTIMKNLLFFWRRKAKDEDAPLMPHFIMTVYECVESLLFGMARIFPALIILTLAWASGAVMVAVGTDRLFSSWIVGGLDPRVLPTLSFLVSFMMALATGTSWGT
jgi:Na+/H+ antiporter NhaC